MDHLHGVHVGGGATGRVEGRRDDAGREVLASGDEIVRGPGRQLAQHAQPGRERLDLREGALDRLQQFLRPRSGADERGDRRAVLRRQPVEGGAGAVRVAPDGRAGEIEQRVRHARHRRDHDDEGRGPLRPDDRHRVRDGRPVRKRGSAEFVDLERASGARHGEPQEQQSPGSARRGRRFLAPCLTWRQYAANHHATSIVCS